MRKRLFAFVQIAAFTLGVNSAMAGTAGSISAGGIRIRSGEADTNYMLFTSEKSTACTISGQSDSCYKQKVYSVEQSTGKSTLKGEWVNPYGDGEAFYDTYTKKLVVRPGNDWEPSGAGWDEYTPKFAVWDSENPDAGVTYMTTPDVLLGENLGNRPDSNILNFSPGGATSPVTVKSNGDIHIGENSLITRERNGVQQLFATDSNGDSIPINITEGSDLQINGVSVKESLDKNAENINTNTENINDLGFGVAGATALSTAMSALPTVAQDSPLSCGVGTGGYSSRFAMSVGCAVKANDRLSINAGGSYVFGGAADYGNGSLSTAAARAGFVFKLGNLEKPAASNEELQSQLDEVQEENASIKSKYESMEQRYISIEQQNKELMARLQRLEAIALGNQPAETAVSLK